MKYFTPERYLRLQDRSNEQGFLMALEDWERAVAEYREHLEQMRAKAPNGLRQLSDLVCLHDAAVLDMWWGGRTRFTITLHPESEPSRLVILTYSLLASPEVSKVLPEAVRPRPVGWLYDELNVINQSGESGFSHDILLSDGREVFLQCRGVTVLRPIPLIPSTPESHLSANPIRHSA